MLNTSPWPRSVMTADHKLFPEQCSFPCFMYKTHTNAKPGNKHKHTNYLLFQSFSFARFPEKCEFTK